MGRAALPAFLPPLASLPLRILEKPVSRLTSSSSSLGLGGTCGFCRVVRAGKVEASLAFAKGQLGLLGSVLLRGGDCLWLDRLSRKIQTRKLNIKKARMGECLN